MSNKCGQIISVKIGRESVDKVFHDNTLKGVGRPDDLLGIADSVLENIESKVSDVIANGESVVVDHIANLTIPTDISDITTPEQQAAINSGINSEKAEQITTNQNNIANINSKIPSQASAENQLADKNFVNSSVATNTANFIGTFNSVADLEAYSGTLTNNDYAFVISTDSAGNTVYNRYKYTTATTPASWQFEYALNNSSFTAEQWAAINSGATTTNIGQIATNTSTISGHISNTNNPHSVTKAQVGLGNVDNTSDANKPISTATQTALDGKANTSLSNLTSTGKNITNWSSNVSNCITEIPQDIKLELNNGTLTLKAGSKVYHPNGANDFNTYTTSVDISVTGYGTGTRQMMVFVRYRGSAGLDTSSAVYSGSESFSGNGIYYNTTTNNIDYYTNGSASGRNYCFPIAVITMTDATITSIDQVFNGIGYVGSTVFALPGVAGLIADGRNADGTLKSTYFKTTSVLTGTPSNGTRCFTIRENLLDFPLSSNISYDADKNYMFNSTDIYQSVVFDITTISSGTVSSFNPRQVFHAVGYNDTEFIVHQTMPSFTYTNLALPASGNTITAPADGYLYVSKQSGAAGEYIRAMVQDNVPFNIYEAGGFAAGASEDIKLLLPVSKGAAVKFYYTLSGSTGGCRFVYANGSK